MIPVDNLWISPGMMAHGFGPSVSARVWEQAGSRSATKRNQGVLSANGKVGKWNTEVGYFGERFVVGSKRRWHLSDLRAGSEGASVLVPRVEGGGGARGLGAHWERVRGLQEWREAHSHGGKDSRIGVKYAQR